METNDLFSCIREDAERIECWTLGDLNHVKTGQDEIAEFHRVFAAVNKAYPAFLRYFDQPYHSGQSVSYTAYDILIAYSFCSAWKTAKQEFEHDHFEALALLLSDVRNQNWKITDEELRMLAEQAGDSFATATKILHFCSPKRFAILDIHVLRYIKYWETGVEPSDKAVRKELKKPATFRAYWDLCHNLAKDSRMAELNAFVKDKLGYDKLSDLRALEVVMYYTAKRKSLPSLYLPDNLPLTRK